MTKQRSSDIGAHILRGIRQLKRGEFGRVVTFPPVSETRARVGLFISVGIRAVARGIGSYSARVGTRPPCSVGAGPHPPGHCAKDPRALLESTV